MEDDKTKLNLLFVGFATMDIYPDGKTIPGGAGGGMSLNAASLPYVNSHLLTALGKDKHGTSYRETLTKHGVDTSNCLTSPQNPTCKIDDPFGESFKRDWSDNGAAKTLLEHDFDQIDFDKFDGIVLANAFPELVDKLSKSLVKTTAPIFYIPGPHIVWHPQKLNLVVLSNSEVVFANDQESPIVQKHDPVSLGAKVLVSTLGADGCRVTTSDGSQDFPAPQIDKLVDATGAGDCFALGFVVEYLRSQDIAQAVSAGNHLAAKIISKYGVLL